MRILLMANKQKQNKISDNSQGSRYLDFFLFLLHEMRKRTIIFNKLIQQQKKVSISYIL